jgi:tetratricopeptide (TPR) repeat protein
MTTAAPRFYYAGGTLRADAPSYVSRQADEALYASVTHGDFCYVLTARQMGKSSLMVRTAARLQQEGVAVVVLDLTALGQNLTPEQWYAGLLGRIGQQLGLEDHLEDFCQKHDRWGPLQRWTAALQEVVLSHILGRVVLFVDEIDYVRSLPFSTNEFFAAIRECYNRRAQEPSFTRLTFCLFGVATPAELIQDAPMTPFNIGQRIALTDFSTTEAVPLAMGLGRPERIGRGLLKRILYWTGGHPYLTQRLCQAVAADSRVTCPVGVDQLCEVLFLSPRALEQDDNLLFVREYLLRSTADRAGLLDLYAQVHSRRRVRDDDTNPLLSLLHLAGIVRVINGGLRVRNRIYFTVFDQAWIRMHLPPSARRHRRTTAARERTLAGDRAGTTDEARVVETERVRAERRFNEVRQLATMFLFEFHDAIEKLPGSTPARALLVQRALASLASLAQEAGDDPSLQRELAIAYTKVGNVQWQRYHANLGDTAGALESQRKALAIYEALAARERTNRLLLHDLARSYVQVGDTLAAVGDLVDALGSYRRSLAIRQELAAAEPTNAQVRYGMAVSYQRIGDTLGNPSFPNLGDTVGALESYHQMQATFEALSAADPQNVQKRHSLSIGYEKIGDVLAAASDTVGALGNYHVALTIRQALSAADQTNAQLRRDLAVSHRKVGLMLAATGDHAGALESYHQALEIRQALAEVDPTNAAARRDLARIYGDIGQVLGATGDEAGAVENLRASLTIFAALFAADATNVYLRADLVQTLQWLAKLSANIGQIDEARVYTQRLLAVQKE